MPKYEVSSTYYFRENGQKVEAGGTIELTEEQAAERNAAHPGLLKPVRQTTQAHPTVVRDTKPVESKPKRTRAKK
jgi:hypothetical protein